MELITVSVGVSNENGVDFSQSILGKPLKGRCLKGFPGINYNSSAESTLGKNMKVKGEPKTYAL